MESSIKRTQHINIRLYFIKDHIIPKVLNVKQYSTCDKLSYFPVEEVVSIDIFHCIVPITV